MKDCAAEEADCSRPEEDEDGPAGDELWIRRMSRVKKVCLTRVSKLH